MRCVLNIDDRADVLWNDVMCVFLFIRRFESTVEKEGKKQGIAHFHQKN